MVGTMLDIWDKKSDTILLQGSASRKEIRVSVTIMDANWKEVDGLKETVMVDKRIGFLIIIPREHSDKNWMLKVLQV